MSPRDASTQPTESETAVEAAPAPVRTSDRPTARTALRDLERQQFAALEAALRDLER